MHVWMYLQYIYAKHKFCKSNDLHVVRAKLHQQHNDPFAISTTRANGKGHQKDKRWPTPRLYHPNQHEGDTCIRTCTYNHTHVVCPTKETTRVLSRLLSSAPQWRDQIPLSLMYTHTCSSTRLEKTRNSMQCFIQRVGCPGISHPKTQASPLKICSCCYTLYYFPTSNGISSPIIVISKAMVLYETLVCDH